MDAKDSGKSQSATSPAAQKHTAHLPGAQEGNERMRQEVDRSQRYNHPLSVALMDLDPLPAAMVPRGVLDDNGIMGHFVRRVKAVQRDCDTLCAWGLTTVLWILPETELDAGVLACERLRRALAGASPGNTPPLTVSIGIAELEPGEDANHLVKRATDALLISQARGRNCVTRADVLPRPDSAA